MSASFSIDQFSSRLRRNHSCNAPGRRAANHAETHPGRGVQTSRAFLARLLAVLSSPPSDWPSLLPDWPSLLRYLGTLAVLGVGAASTGHAFWHAWIAPRPARGDLWAYSDRVGYEGDSPRDIQARIDALRAQSVHEGE